jgi:hypothetical protein
MHNAIDDCFGRKMPFYYTKVFAKYDKNRKLNPNVYSINVYSAT